MWRLLFVLLGGLVGAIWGCAVEPIGDGSIAATQDQPSILLVTLDTTRADRIEPEGPPGSTPHLLALAQRGRRYSRAYTTAPLTLPAHASLFTGLTPADHGIHENSRSLGREHQLLAELLRASGYRTAAVVSGFPLRRQFGLGRGFDPFDDDLGAGLTERDARASTERALEMLASEPESSSQPLFLWVHYYDAHYPYAAPEPFASRWPDDPYQAEIAFVDEQVGRLLQVFERQFPKEHRIVVVGDHGEGLGERGEDRHGNLLSEGVMRVPLVVAGTGVQPEVVETPVGISDLFELIRAWSQGHLEARPEDGAPPVVVGEAMRPFLQYGWQPQTLAVSSEMAVAQSGVGADADIEVLRAPGVELGSDDSTGMLPREIAVALRDYPRPKVAPEGEDQMSVEDRRALASLGYAGSAGVAPRRGEGTAAPHAGEMTHLFVALDRGSELFVRGDYAAAILRYQEVLAEDPENFTVVLRLAVAHSVLGRRAAADSLFARAAELNPGSLDLRHYHAQHLLFSSRWEEAEPLFLSVLAQQPGRRESLRGLAEVRRRQGDLERAEVLLRRLVESAEEPVESWLRLGAVRMALGETEAAIEAFEAARRQQEDAFVAALDLGVCYLAVGRFSEAARELDRIESSDPAFPLALFKRAQVAVLLGEADAAARIEAAWERADPQLRQLMAQEPLFEGRR